MKIIKSFEKIEKREILDCRIKSLKEQLNFYGYELNSLEILFYVKLLLSDMEKLIIKNSQYLTCHT